MTELNLFSFSEYDLNEILESSQTNKLVFFIGAGFSKFSETELIKTPSWSELINELKNDLMLSEENDFLKIAQLYYLKYGQHSYAKKIKSTIKDLEPSIFHKKLFELNPRYVITTNWDNLLEKTSRKMGLSYDLVSSDEDLAQSHLDKKIIKMHGDFLKNNFVFKEDDYLQYSYNFPLIENFIKGIFSTSTVVFLGYSYSDYNLKQISSWVSTISKATPRKFLLHNLYNDAQALYLKNHGISLLVPVKTDVSYYSLYLSFFNELKVIQNPKEYNQNIIKISDLEIEKINNNQSLLPQDRDALINKVHNIVINIIKKYIDSKLKTLAQYKMLLPEQISKKLTNSTIEYEQTEVVLFVHDKNLTNDYNKYIRRVNELYICSVFNNNASIENNMFLSILDKAQITEVHCKSKNHKVPTSLTLDTELSHKLSFLYSKDSAEFLLATNKYGKLLKLLMSEVEQHINGKNYILATISMANFDYVHSMFKQYTSRSINTVDENDKKFLEDISPYGYKKEIFNFPWEFQNDLQDLVELLGFSEVYKLYYLFDVESRKNQDYAKIREKGGMVYSVDEYKLRSKLYSYLKFILGNGILIDEYIEFERLFEFNMIGSIEHYLHGGHFHVNIIDLFILIKYTKTKSLKDISSKLTKDKKIIDLNKIDIKGIFYIKKYLLNSFENICYLMSQKDRDSIQSTPIDKWFNNILVILGMTPWSSNQFKKIISSFLPILEYNTTNLVTPESIEYFLKTNASLYENSHPDILKILDVILDKIKKGLINGYDIQIVNMGYLYDIFSLAKTKGYLYDNVKLLDLLLLKVQDDNEEIKQLFINRLLPCIKNIGSDEVIESIDRFIDSNSSNK